MKDPVKSQFKTFIKIFVILCGIVVLWIMESEDVQNEVAQYCENVKDNTWPNYKEVDISQYCN